MAQTPFLKVRAVGTASKRTFMASYVDDSGKEQNLPKGISSVSEAEAIKDLKAKL